MILFLRSFRPNLERFLEDFGKMGIVDEETLEAFKGCSIDEVEFLLNGEVKLSKLEMLALRRFFVNSRS